MMRKLGVVWTIVLLSSLAGVASGGTGVGQAIERPSSTESMVRWEGPSTQTAGGADPVLLAAGDIGDCHSRGDEATAALVRDIAGTVATLGDNAYETGSRQEFSRCYDPTWGSEKARTRPAAGNHEYETRNAKGYFDYFGRRPATAARGTTATTSAPGISSSSTPTATDRRLWAELAAGSLVARGSGGPPGNLHPRLLAPSPVQLRDGHGRRRARCDRSGKRSTMPGRTWCSLRHEHNYERFAPQDPSGRFDRNRGIRQFVVGTGGSSHYPFGHRCPRARRAMRRRLACSC